MYHKMILSWQQSTLETIKLLFCLSSQSIHLYCQNNSGKVSILLKWFGPLIETILYLNKPFSKFATLPCKNPCVNNICCFKWTSPHFPTVLSLVTLLLVFLRCSDVSIKYINYIKNWNQLIVQILMSKK